MDIDTSINELTVSAYDLRLSALKMIYNAGSGHIGGSFSIADIITALFLFKANLSAGENRDRIFISKGHCAPVYYAALSKAGFFPEEELVTFRKFGSRLQGHPSLNVLPGVEMSSGPLGLGASVSIGCALGLKLKKSESHVYCILGDGETQEGIVWEAAMSAAKFSLDNLTFIVDCNRHQLSGSIETTMPVNPVSEKWESFGWQTITIDGHDMKQILSALDSTGIGMKKPRVIIANTIKGKGVPFMENTHVWHGKVPDSEQMLRAEKELLSIQRKYSGRKNFE